MPRLKQEKQIHGHLWGIRVGTEIVASTVIALTIGYFLDQWLHTRPLFLIVFAVFGLVAGLINLYHIMVIDVQDKQDE